MLYLVALRSYVISLLYTRYYDDFLEEKALLFVHILIAAISPFLIVLHIWSGLLARDIWPLANSSRHPLFHISDHTLRFIPCALLYKNIYERCGYGHRL